MNKSINKKFLRADICNGHIRESFSLARDMTILADQGETDAQDDGCMVLYGVMRDCACKIRTQAEREKSAHIEKGVWA